MHYFEIKETVFGEGKPLICLPVTERTESDVLRETQRLVQMQAQVIEWRVDAYENSDDWNAIRQLLKAMAPLIEKTPFIFTFRSKEQGGMGSLTEEQISDLHQIAAESHVVDFVDVEFFQMKNPNKEIKMLQDMGVRVIASHHDFNETPQPEIMQMLLQRMQESGADIVKLAVMPQTQEDVLALMLETNRFVQNYPKIPVVTMSMGTLGKVSRVSGELTGSCMTFGNPGVSSAPGQIEARELAKILDVLHSSDLTEHA